MFIFLQRLLLTSNIDELVKSSTPTLDKNSVHEESISDIQDALVESSTVMPDDIDILEDDTSDFEYVWVESSVLIQVARYSLVIPIIEDGIEYETVDTSV